uniref:Uncharacterized protein n=1 Tax=Myotis myotis TaxID=51298 RepID=A0A7J7VI25_MYOMY|nr:hypothetical protein mMyoMyo1_008319 [Myotis myotis]
MLNHSQLLIMFGEDVEDLLLRSLGGFAGGRGVKRSTEGLICMHIRITNGHKGVGEAGGMSRGGGKGDICNTLCNTSRNKNYFFKKRSLGVPGQVAQLFGASSCTPKHCRFDSQSEHIPVLRFKHLLRCV